HRVPSLRDVRSVVRYRKARRRRTNCCTGKSDLERRSLRAVEKTRMAILSRGDCFHHCCRLLAVWRRNSPHTLTLCTSQHAKQLLLFCFSSPISQRGRGATFGRAAPNTEPR